MAIKLKPAPIFSDHMVLSRGSNIRVFGDAEDGITVRVSIYDHTVSCRAVKGNFEAIIPQVPVGGPYNMTISDGQTTVLFSNVLIGDVFLAGGQSNMEMRLLHAENGEQLTQTANYPQIRYCNYPVPDWPSPERAIPESQASWRLVAPGICGDISAAAFHFAVDLHQDLHVPIGIIGCYLGGTSITSWMDEDALMSVSGGRDLYAAYENRIAGQTQEQYRQKFQVFSKANGVWNQGAAAMKAKDPQAGWNDFIRELGPCPWPPPEGKCAPFRTGGFAETMIKRIAPYTLTGVLFYQGESDCSHPHLYKDLLMRLILFWRQAFKNPYLPFLIVQLPMFGQMDESVPNSWAILREGQDAAYRQTRGTGLAVLIDSGDKEDVHPRDKQTVGHRLYLQALLVIYGRHIDGASPRALSILPDGARLIVRISAHLQQTENPPLFEIAGDEGTYYPADAQIEGDVITLSSARVSQPLAARYAWVDFGTVTVFGLNGLPLAPFCIA